MGSLFAGLFAAPKQQAGSSGGSGLFSSSSKYAAPPLAASAAPPAATAEPSGGRKKRRKQEAQAEASAAPAAAATAAGGEPSSKKARKAQEQRGKQVPEQRQQQADKAAAAAAAAAAAPPAEREKKEGKKRKQQQVGKEDRQGAVAPASAPTSAALPTAEGPGRKASSKPGKATSKAVAPAAEAATEQQANKAAEKAGGKVAERAAAPKSKGGKAEAQEDERLPRTVFVGNLPASVKRKALARLFAAAGCGAVETVRLRSLPLKQEPESKIPRKNAIAAGKIDTEHSAHAYVVLEEEAAVDKALALNMTEFEGHHIRVDRAAPASAKGAVAFDHTRTLFVGNLPHDCEDEELIKHFDPKAVEAVRILRDGKTGTGKGVAFVLFRSQEASKAALRSKRSGELRGRKLRLTVAKKQAAASSKPAAWQQGKDSSGKSGGKSSNKGSKSLAGKRKTGGKRPAVAARKAATKLAAKGGVQKKRMA